MFKSLFGGRKKNPLGALRLLWIIKTERGKDFLGQKGRNCSLFLLTYEVVHGTLNRVD
jgi:hypothetical protein